MKKYILYIVGLILSMATIGCVKTDDTPSEQMGVVKLRLANGVLSTRTDAAPNDDMHNEDLIANAQIFFLSSDGEDATVLHSEYKAIGENESAEVSISLSTSQLSTLFGQNNTAYVYVIANYGSKIDTTDETTLGDLKNTPIESSFDGGKNGVQSSFVMDSEPVSVTRSGNNLTVNYEDAVNYEEGKDYIELVRAAAKVQLTVNVVPIEIEEGDVTTTWIANTAGMRVSFFNGVKDGIIDDDSDVSPKAAQGDAEKFNIDQDNSRGFALVSGVVGNGSFVHEVPFYSYSTKWNTEAEVENGNEVYMTLSIPWSADGGKSYQTYYYLVPVGVDQLALVRNCFYKVTLDVGVFGGLVDPVTVEPSYVVIDWGTNNVNVNLSLPTYLVVDRNYVVVNNLEDITVGYQSSHEVKVEVISSTFNSYYSSTKDEWDAVNNDMSVTAANGVITFHHSLDNTREASDGDPADRYDYQMNTVKVKVSHKNNPNIFEEITFVQYPAMYVTYVDSSDYVMVNNNTSTSSNWQYVIASPISGTNLYTVTVSAFDASTSDFIITDPREPMNNETFTFDRATNADATGDNSLTGYRATIEGEESMNLVAPSFIIASSYGAYRSEYDLYAENTAKYRCAAYQEAGYPAGRWRLPTPAELKVIGQLCVEGKMDNIFYSRYDYATSYIPYKYDDSNKIITESTRADRLANSVRCVYDIWYWKDKCKDQSQFIWGAEGDIANGAKSAYLVSVE